MAGRIRTVKPELNEDERVGRLSHEAFRVFVVGINEADDHGNLRADGDLLAAKAFWGRPMSAGTTMASIFAELDGLWVFYEVRGQRYAHYNGWSKHQRVDQAGAPRVPVPPGWRVEERLVGGDGRRQRKVYTAHPPTDTTATRCDGHNELQQPPASDAPSSKRDLLLDVTAGSPISDLRSPTTTTSDTDAGGHEPDDSDLECLVTMVTDCVFMVGQDANEVARSWYSMAKRKKRSAEDLEIAATYALDILDRASHSKKGVGEAAAYATSTIASLLDPGGLEGEREQREQRTRPKPTAGPGSCGDDFARDAVADMERTERDARSRRRTGTGEQSAGDLFGRKGAA